MSRNVCQCNGEGGGVLNTAYIAAHCNCHSDSSEIDEAFGGGRALVGFTICQRPLIGF